MGYSLGGGVALRTAIQHPDLVRKLVLVSTPFKREGWYPAIRDGMAQMDAHVAEAMKPTPMYQTYASLAPKLDDWPVLLTKRGKKDAGWDGSGMSTAQLAILPGLTHYAIFASPARAATVTAFLDAP